MRSPRGFAASVVLILGVLLAAVAPITFHSGADPIIHLALGGSFVLILCVEAYAYGMAYLGAAVPGILKVLYIPLFIWLMLESRKPREASQRRRRRGADRCHV